MHSTHMCETLEVFCMKYDTNSTPNVRLSSRTRIVASCRDSTRTRGDRVDDVQFVVISKDLRWWIESKEDTCKDVQKNVLAIVQLSVILKMPWIVRLRGLLDQLSCMPYRLSCRANRDVLEAWIRQQRREQQAGEANLRTGSSPRDLRWLL